MIYVSVIVPNSLGLESFTHILIFMSPCIKVVRMLINGCLNIGDKNRVAISHCTFRSISVEIEIVVASGAKLQDRNQGLSLYN